MVKRATKMRLTAEFLPDHPQLKTKLRGPLQKIERIDAHKPIGSLQLKQNTTQSILFRSVLASRFLQIPLDERRVCLARHKVGIRENLPV